MSYDKIYLIGNPEETQAEFDEAIEVTNYDSESDTDNWMRYEKSVLENMYEGALPSIVEDLIRVSIGLFAADLATERPSPDKNEEDEFRNFSRRIKLIVPVTSVDKWHEAKNAAEKAASFMTYDDIEIEFVEADRDMVELQETDSDYNSISLFSGGLDSLGGSYYVNEEDTLFLSIVSSGIKNGRVLDNLEEIRNIDLERIKIGREVNYKEKSQFSRSFLYLSIALSTALINGINEVILPENGVVARQVGLNQGRKPTRTAHPRFIEYYEKFANDLIDQDIAISNPLDKKTKSEVIDLIEDEECIPKAYSCSHTRFPFWADKEAGEKQHCGMGIPCLFRTVALIGSNVTDVEEKLNLAFNPFKIDFSNVDRAANVEEPDKQPVKTYYREGVSSVLEMTQFAYEILNSDRDEIALEYPELSDEEVYNMYKKFASNVELAAKYFSEDDAEKPIADRFR